LKDRREVPKEESLAEELTTMIRVRRTRLFHGFPAFIALVGLSCLAVSAQDLNSAAPSQAQIDLSPAPVAAKSTPTAPITVLEDTLIRVMTTESLNSKRVEHGTPVSFTVSEDVVVGDRLAIPRGATVHGMVIKSKKAGRLTGSPEITLKLVSLDLGGRKYPLYSYQFKVTGTSKTGPTETKVLRGATVGAVAGSFVSGVSSKGVVTPNGSGRVASMTAGAGIGAGVGTAIAAATPGPGIWIPSESQIDFYLAAPITVTAIGAKDAARLAQGLHSGGPTLYVRGDTP
jgi:hypothetical protein